MHREQRQRTHDLLSSNGVDLALFANPHTVTWLTGFAPSVQLGPNLFAGGPPLVWYDSGHFTLIVLDAQADEAGDFGSQTDCELRTYEGYTIEEPISSVENLAGVLHEVAGATRTSTRFSMSIGVENQQLTASLAQVLQRSYPDHNDWTAIDSWLTPLRMVKTDEEIELLRRSFELADVGHAAARRAAEAGMREIDVWTEIHSAVEREAGQRVPLGNDCRVGYSENNMGGWPLDSALRPQDSVIVDLSVVWCGYWSDSCATYYVGEPTERQVAMHQSMAEALDYAISLIRPGAVAMEIDRQVRQFVEDAGYSAYPHHTGHGVGVSGHEEPRIVPYNDVTLEEGMVILLEPGTYVAGETGVRLEDAVLVTSDGAEVLTSHDKSLP